MREVQVQEVILGSSVGALQRDSSERLLATPGGAASSRGAPNDASRRAVSPRFAATSPRFQAVSITMRHLEELDCKLMNQLAQTQQRADQSRERLRTWMEQKMQTIIGVQTKNDMKVAELSGNMAALSDEVQSQVRRGELLDMKYWEWRRDFEEEVRQKLADMEAKFDEAFTSSRSQMTAAERSAARASEQVKEVELMLGVYGSKDAGMRSDLELISERLAQVEEQTQQALSLVGTRELALDMNPMDDGLARAVSSNQERLAEMERQVAQLDRANVDSRDAFGEISARLEAHEEKIKATRTVIDQQRELVLGTRAKFESMDVDARVEQAFKSLASSKAEGNAEKWEVLTARLDVLEDALENLRSLTISGVSVAPVPAAVGMTVAPQVSPTDELFAPAPAVIMERIAGPSVATASTSEALAADGLLAARLEQLLQKLTAMGPAVVRHEEILRDLVTQKGQPGDSTITSDSLTVGDSLAREQLERLATRMEAMTGTSVADEASPAR